MGELGHDSKVRCTDTPVMRIAAHVLAWFTWPAESSHVRFVFILALRLYPLVNARHHCIIALCRSYP